MITHQARTYMCGNNKHFMLNKLLKETMKRMRNKGIDFLSNLIVIIKQPTTKLLD